MALVKTTHLSPAKINLMLRILSQRTDGYHELQTCFQILDWGDWLTFEQLNVRGENQVHVEGVAGVSAADNIISQAAAALKSSAQSTSDWLIHVDKQIPMGGGLGGGSSNAATTLKFLDQAWQCNLSNAKLQQLASQLGADVPVFIAGRSCLATGIGEKLLPMAFHTPHILLLFPDCHINTAALFADAGLSRDQVALGSSMLHDRSFWINDFFPLVLDKYPAVEQIYQALKPSMSVRLSGSGSTMFVVFDSATEAHLAHELAQQICETRLVVPKKESDAQAVTEMSASKGSKKT